MTFVGMDLDDMTRVATGLRQRAGELHDVVATIDALMLQSLVEWLGASSVELSAAWAFAHRAGVEGAARELEGAAERLDHQVAQQRDASYGPRIDHSDRDLWALTDATQAKRQPDPGWTELTNESVHDPATGFDAVVYRDASGRVIVVYPGTDGDADVATDIAGGAGLVTGQGRQAIALARRLEEKYGEGNVSFAGYSLGGRLAALSSLATGERAVTFNAAGVNPAEAILAQSADGNVAGAVVSGYAGARGLTPPGALLGAALGDQAAISSNVTNYHAVGDPLSIGQNQSPVNDAVGRQVPLAALGHEISDLGAQVSDD